MFLLVPLVIYLHYISTKVNYKSYFLFWGGGAIWMRYKQFEWDTSFVYQDEYDILNEKLIPVYFTIFESLKNIIWEKDWVQSNLQYWSYCFLKRFIKRLQIFSSTNYFFFIKKIGCYLFFNNSYLFLSLLVCICLFFSICIHCVPKVFNEGAYRCIINN